MIEFPKIETLYDRKEDFSVDPTKLRKLEFGNIKVWQVTEKIDGTNIRIGMNPDGSIHFGGRTDNAQMPTFLMDYLIKTFTPERVQAAFDKNEDGTFTDVTIFSEGYGAKIQKGGGLYRRDCAVRIFDVLVSEWWLSPENVMDVANKLGVKTVPGTVATIGYLPTTEDELRTIIGRNGLSSTAIEDSGQEREAEGIVARAYPMLYLPYNARVIWKLKFSDFRKGKK